MRVYVAGRWTRRHEAAALADELMERGHEITHRWWNEEDPGPGTREQHAEFYALCAAADVTGVLSADAMILIHDPTCRGAFVEFGIALAEGVRIFVVNGMGNPAESCPLFYFLPEVQHVPNTRAALEAVDEFARAA